LVSVCMHKAQRSKNFEMKTRYKNKLIESMHLHGLLHAFRLFFAIAQRPDRVHHRTMQDAQAQE
ncbi:MAG: hypothetical protein Q9M25_02120, partial [Mariprofundaceae bacterium]|nr:hypothetical protein [Mariprofundaceae bacterium]